MGHATRAVFGRARWDQPDWRHPPSAAHRLASRLAPPAWQAMWPAHKMPAEGRTQDRLRSWLASPSICASSSSPASAPRSAGYVSPAVHHAATEVLSRGEGGGGTPCQQLPFAPGHQECQQASGRQTAGHLAATSRTEDAGHGVGKAGEKVQVNLEPADRQQAATAVRHGPGLAIARLLGLCL